MLANYTRPPGPSNRGERSEVAWDKRPIHEQAYDIRDKHRLRIEKEIKNGTGRLNELKSLI